MKLDEIKNYLSLEKKELFDKIIHDIYSMSNHLNESYPNYANWFYEKQVKGLNNNRNILFVKNDNNDILGFCCIKSDAIEKKICTLFVHPDYRKLGISYVLLDSALEHLETLTPLITFSEEKISMFSRIIKHYNWYLVEAIDDLYFTKSRELCFNQSLTENSRFEFLMFLRNLKEEANKNLSSNEQIKKL